MLKCYCDSCEKETTAKYATMQIKLRGSEKTLVRHLCIKCYEICMDAIKNNLQSTEVEIVGDDKEKPITAVNPSQNELEVRFYSICGGVDAGKVCSLFNAGWIIKDIAGEMSIDEEKVETIIEMYEMYGEIPDTSMCKKPEDSITSKSIETKVVEEEVKPQKSFKGNTSPKASIVTAIPDYIDEYCKTLGERSKPDRIKVMLQTLCSGNYTVKSLAEEVNLQYQNVLCHIHKYHEFCDLKKL